MEFAEVDIRADRSGFDAVEKLFGLHLQNEATANQIECLVLRCARPAVLGRAVLDRILWLDAHPIEAHRCLDRDCV